jgi:CheY-like chemotaxis protein
VTTVDTRDLHTLRRAPRPDTDRLLDQLRGSDAFNHTRRQAEVESAAPRSRETRLDLSRRMDVIRRQHQALIEAADQQLRESAQLLLSRPAARAVLVHRNDWFQSKVSAGLAAAGVRVVAALSNGADAVGVVVAEQPDLLLLEDKLPMFGGDELVRDVRRYAPRTSVVVQVENEWEIERFLTAGADVGFARRVPPADVAAAVSALYAG